MLYSPVSSREAFNRRLRASLMAVKRLFARGRIICDHFFVYRRGVEQMQGSVLPAGKADVRGVKSFLVGDNHYDVAVGDVFSHRGVAKVLFGDVLLPPTGERLFCRSDFARHLIVAVHHGIERRMGCHVIYIENLSPGEWLVGVVVFTGKALMLSIVDPRGKVMQSILVCHIAILISNLSEILKILGE